MEYDRDCTFETEIGHFGNSGLLVETEDVVSVVIKLGIRPRL